MSDPLYLLDTNIVFSLVRGKELGERIDARYKLRASKVRPLVCIVTHGELRVLAGRNNWGPPKVSALLRALEHLVTVDINHPSVLDAYVEIDLASQHRNMGKNDLWIAACAKAAGATLLTCDKDFDHLNPTLLSVEYIEPNLQPTA